MEINGLHLYSLWLFHIINSYVFTKIKVPLNEFCPCTVPEKHIVTCVLKYMKGFMTKGDIRHFWKVEMKGKTVDLFLFIFVFLEPLITSKVYICNISNKAKIVYVRYCWYVLFQLKNKNIKKLISLILSRNPSHAV